MTKLLIGLAYASLFASGGVMQSKLDEALAHYAP